MAASILALVSYSDSSSEDEKETPEYHLSEEPMRKRKLSSPQLTDGHKAVKTTDDKTNSCPALPSVPQGILDMFGGNHGNRSSKNAQDSPDFHQGRVRSFAHERGNWASYVHIPVVADAYWQTLVNAVIAGLSEVAEFHLMEDFHVSLSRTFIMRHHWIDSMVTLLKEHLGSFRKFTCDLSSIQFYANDEKTRTFVGLRVRCGIDQLQEAVKEVDRCLCEFKLPTYYLDPSFHVSIGWALGDVTSICSPQLQKQLQAVVDDYIGIHPQTGLLEVTEIRLKTGNKLYSFPVTENR